MKEKLGKEKEAEINEIKDKNEELKTKIKNLTTNQITNNFGKITIKIDNVIHEKHTIKDKTDKNWKKTCNNILFWVQRLYAEF